MSMDINLGKGLITCLNNIYIATVLNIYRPQLLKCEELLIFFAQFYIIEHFMSLCFRHNNQFQDFALGWEICDGPFWQYSDILLPKRLKK